MTILFQVSFISLVALSKSPALFVICCCHEEESLVIDVES